MWRILKKNLIFPVGYLTFMLLLLTAIQIAIGNELNVPLVLVSGIMPFFLILGVIFMNEQYEEKHNGYAFLDILPLKAHEIVAPKFLLIFCGVVILTSLTIILLYSTTAIPEQLVLARSYILLGMCVSLVFAGILYTSIFAISYIKSIMIVLIFTTAIGFVPLLIMKKDRDQMDALIDGILNWLTHLNWIVILPLTLVLYCGLMLLSIHIKNIRSA